MARQTLWGFRQRRSVADVLIASFGTCRRGVGFGRPIAIGRTGVEQRRLKAEMAILGDARASMVVGWSRRSISAALECGREPDLIMMCRS
jgi:hypothetical protein